MIMDLKSEKVIKVLDIIKKNKLTADERMLINRLDIDLFLASDDAKKWLSDGCKAERLGYLCGSNVVKTDVQKVCNNGRYHVLQEILILLCDVYFGNDKEAYKEWVSFGRNELQFSSSRVKKLLKETMRKNMSRAERERLFAKIRIFINSSTSQEYNEWRNSGAGNMIAMEKQSYIYMDEQAKINGMDNRVDSALQKRHDMHDKIKEILTERYLMDDEETKGLLDVLCVTDAYEKMLAWLEENKEILDMTFKKDSPNAVWKLIDKKYDEFYNLLPDELVEIED